MLEYTRVGKWKQHFVGYKKVQTKLLTDAFFDDSLNTDLEAQLSSSPCRQTTDNPTNNLSDAELLSARVTEARSQLTFTGERVVPGAVEPQLWNEHISRYRFACQFANGKSVLDVGCGAGYGTELLGRRARLAVGFDVSDEAICYATERFSQAEFACSSASSVPFKARSFQLITAFEVIEHLADWQAMLQEAKRVMSLDGIFLVSTPNRDYYNESRGFAGPNPYHVHEFDLSEFDTALQEVFPFVQIVAQNQQENITFSATEISGVTSAYVPPVIDLPNSHFFLAVCSFRPIRVPFFADVSCTYNLLRERERHIRGVQGELADARKAYGQLLEAHQTLSEQHRLACAEQQRLTVEVEQAKHCAWTRLGRAFGLGPWSKDESRERFIPGKSAKSRRRN